MHRSSASALTRLAWIVVVLLLAKDSGALAADRVVTNPDGATLRVGDSQGSWLAEQLHPTPPPTASASPAQEGGESRESHDPETGRTVDSQGRIQGGLDAAQSLALAADSVARVTIDRMSVRSLYGYPVTYDGTGLELFSAADRYFLSDDTSWASGAGSFTRSFGRPAAVEVDGSTIRYTIDPPTDDVLYRQTDFDSGDHSAQGTLRVSGPLVIEAVLGSTTAVLKGEAVLAANDATWYGEPRFNYYSAVVGSLVPFEITYSLLYGATWSTTTFESTFSFTYQGTVDFAAATFPALVDLQLRGSGQLPPNASVQYFAIASYEGGAQQDVSADAEWTIAPESAASVSIGTVDAGPCDGIELTLRANYARDGESRSAEKRVLCTSGASGGEEDWETFQGDPRHSGYIPISLEPSVFGLRWQRTVGSGQPLNPVTAADGKVFVSLDLRFNNQTGLFVLDERDGETLWSRGFGSVNSVNPPAYGHGNVYIQTGNHSTDTYLWAFDANTGAPVFKSPHQAQWESYYAPTVFDGSVYVNGGYYGGMYGFSAFSGGQHWFLPLSQYDEWTPAVDALNAYAYVGESAPGLYVADRITGALRYRIPDPNFSWNGWSMRLAPVLGEMDDVLAIHGGRLLRFDLQQRVIAWQLRRNFSGQPSVAQGVVYAIDAGKLVAVDEESGVPQWTWTPPAGQLTGSLIATRTHVLASTANTVYAVEILSRTHVWSHPVGGQLALGRETLYIASPNGSLTAIATPEYTPAELARLQISGPSRVTENGTATFTATAFYDDGRVRDRSHLSQWSVEPATFADVDAFGQLTVGELLVPSQSVVVRARYSEGDVSVAAELPVELVIGVSLDDFVERNLLAAHALKEGALADLEAAEVREQAARAVLEGESSRRGAAPLRWLRNAMLWGEKARLSLSRSLRELQGALGSFGE